MSYREPGPVIDSSDEDSFALQVSYILSEQVKISGISNENLTTPIHEQQ